MVNAEYVGLTVNPAFWAADTLKVVESSVPITTANPLFSLNNVTKNIADATAGADKLSSVKTLLNIIPKG